MKLELEELLKHESVKKWYYRRAPAARTSATYHFVSYLEWRRANGLSTNPDEWIRECKQGNNLTLESHLDLIKEWAQGSQFDGAVKETRTKYYSDLRGFYRAHRVHLPQEPLDLEAGEAKIPVDVTATKFLEMAGVVVNYSGISTRDRSIIMTMVQGGMDDSTLANVFNFVAFPQLVTHFGTEEFARWDEEKVPVRVDLMRTKTDYFYYTGQHRDAITCLKAWLAVRTSQFGPIRIYPSNNPRTLPTSDPIYLNKYGRKVEPWVVCELFREDGKAAGVNVIPQEKLPRFKGAKRRYQFHSHECRDTIVTLHRRVGVDRPIVDFLVGHNIDKDGYDKDPRDQPEWFMAQYDRLASSYLNLISGKEQRIKAEFEKTYEEKLKERDEKIASMQENVARVTEIVEELKRRGVIP